VLIPLDGYALDVNARSRCVAVPERVLRVGEWSATLEGKPLEEVKEVLATLSLAPPRMIKPSKEQLRRMCSFYVGS
jgi:hypothetical protein